LIAIALVTWGSGSSARVEGRRPGGESDPVVEPA
jgi:hypothetical protein